MITENQVVSHFFTKATLSQREAGWLETLSNFNISTLFLKRGAIHVLGDALSRIAPLPEDVQPDHQANEVSAEMLDVDNESLPKILRYEDDQSFKHIINAMEGVLLEDAEHRRRLKLILPRFSRDD